MTTEHKSDGYANHDEPKYTRYHQTVFELQRTYMHYTEGRGADIRDPEAKAAKEDRVRNVPLREVAQWLLDCQRYRVAPKTWVLYRNAIIKVSLDPDIKEMLDGVKAAVKRRDIPRRGSGLRQKHLSPADLAAIENWVTARRLRWGTSLLLLLKAGVMTGLRPSEWLGANMIMLPRDRQALRVKNAKNIYSETDLRWAKTGGKNNQEYRTIPLDHLDEYDVKIISDHMAFANAMGLEGYYDKYIRGCLDVLNRATLRIWPRRKKRPSLYSARHQFAANCKVALTPEQTAVLLGHRSIRTQTECYGRRIKARSRNVPTPLEEEVQAMFGGGGANNGNGDQGYFGASDVTGAHDPLSDLDDPLDPVSVVVDSTPGASRPGSSGRPDKSSKPDDSDNSHSTDPGTDGVGDLDPDLGSDLGSDLESESDSTSGGLDSGSSGDLAGII